MKRNIFLLITILLLFLTGCAPVSTDGGTGNTPSNEGTTENSKDLVDEIGDILDQLGNGIVESAEEVIDTASGEKNSTDTTEQSTYQVKRVVDGDTLVVVNNGVEERVRMLMVDTPEVHNVDTPEPFGPEASEFTKKLLEGQTVTLEFDKEKYDPYDRTLAYVYLADGRMVNELLLEEGLASVVVYRPNNKYESEFRKIEEQAKAANKGIWSN